MRVLVTRAAAEGDWCWGRLSDGTWVVEVKTDKLKPRRKRRSVEASGR
jgi:hypothetical protein